MTPLTGPARGLQRRGVNAWLLGAGLLPGAAARAADTRTAADLGNAPADHKPAGAVIDFDWMDRRRSRAVPARLYCPASEPSDRGVPLVVFSHGIGGSRQGYSYLGRHWSSQGVASLHVQHVGSDAQLWRGNPFGVVDRLHAAAREDEAMARAADVRFAVDRMLDVEARAHGLPIDPARLVMAGHSYGANTTLLALGARVVRQGRVVECPESRFAAGIVISAPPFYGERDLTAVLGRLQVPTLHVTATEDVIEIPAYRSGAADRLDVFRAVPDARKLLAVFEGGSHSVFTDRAFTGGVALNPRLKRATAELAVAFLGSTFANDGAALTRWRESWQHLLAPASVMQFPSLAVGTS